MKNNVYSCYSDKTQSLFFKVFCFVLILPILVVPPTFQSDSWTKIILFKLSLLFIISVVFFKYFYKKNLPFQIFTKKNPVFLVIFIFSLFFLAIIISTIFSTDIRFSIFGSPIRSGGLINLLFLFIFSIFISIFIEEKYFNKLLKINFVTGVVASLFAVIQYFGFIGQVFISFGVGGSGVPSFLGNSTFLAVYMLFLSFLAFTFLIKEKERNKKILYAILCLLFIFTIIISGSRASYIGLLMGTIFYLLFYPKNKLSDESAHGNRIKKLKIIAVVILLSAFSVFLIFNIFPQLGNRYSLLETISSRLSAKRVATDFFGNRLPAWNMTLQAIRNKPLLGWGPENFYIGFEKYYQPVNDSLRREWWDRPHNILLDIFVHYGIFALILYIVFWITILLKLQSFKKNEPDENKVYLAHGIQTMFISYLTALFFNFDEFPIYLISFFFIGFALHLISQHGEKKEFIPPIKSFFNKKPVLITLTILVLFFAWFYNIKPLYLNQKIIWASNLSNNCNDGALTVEKLWPDSGIMKVYTGLSYVNIVKKCATINPGKELEYSQKAVEILKSISKIQPEYSRTWLVLGSFTNVLASKEGDLIKKTAYLSESLVYLQKALELSPNRQEILVEIGTNYLISSNYQKMKDTAEKCIKIDPSRGFCYWYLGISQIFTGDQEAGKNNIAISNKNGYTDPPLIQLGVAYLSQKNYIEAAKVYDQLVKRFHENAGYHAMMAVLSKELGDYKRAAEETLQVFRIQPNNPESLQFLVELFSKSKNPSDLESSMASVAYIYKETGKKTSDVDMLSDSKNLYLQLITNYPNNADYHWALVDVYYNLEEYYKAREEILVTIELNPNYRKGAQDFLNKLPIEAELKTIPQ